MANKYVSLNKLSLFLGNLKNTFASIVHTHAISDIADLQTALDNKQDETWALNNFEQKTNKIQDVESIKDEIVKLSNTEILK